MKGPLAVNDSAALQQTFPVTNLQQIFHKIALEQLFDAKDVANLSLPDISADIIDEMIARVGIVAYGPSNEAEFSHRTFAEYFAADFILNNVMRENTRSSAMKLFAKMITTENFDLLRKFMNDRLDNVKGKTEENIGDGQFPFENCNITEEYATLNYIVKENQTNLLKFVLQTLL